MSPTVQARLYRVRRLRSIASALDFERTATTSNSGSYRIPELPIGEYKVTATSQGFKTVVRTAQVATGAVTHADFALQVGQRTETVEVEGTAPLIDLSSNNNNYVDSQKSKTYLLMAVTLTLF